MKVKLIAATVAAFGSAAAFAQSSVTVSGTLDLAVRQIKDGQTTHRLVEPEGANSSKLVFSGWEDLGGGMKAGFYLDSEISGDTGMSDSRFWGRRSTISLAGGFGEIRLGRDVNMPHGIVGDFDALNGKGVGNVNNMTPPRNFSDGKNFVRADNLVEYFTPVWGGFRARVQASLREGQRNTKLFGMAADYNVGKLETSVGYSQTDVTTVGVVDAAGASTTPAATGTFNYASLGAAYNFGFAKVLGSVVHWQSGKAASGASRKQVNFNIGAMVPVSAAGSVNFAYTQANRSGLGSDEQDGKQFAVQYLHRLSKRTALYASASHIKQDALANVNRSQYNMDGTTVEGRSATGFDVGISHKF